MSRSYKRFPVCKDGGPKWNKFAKRVANKKVRNTRGIPSGRSYKKVYETWNIHDWVCYYPFNKWMERENNRYHMLINGGPWWCSRSDRKKYSMPPDVQEEFIQWARSYYWK